MLDLAARRGVPHIAVHAFLDGRDTPPRSARASLEKLEKKCASIAGAFVASVSGRYYAMDRDKRWDRVKLAYDAIANGESPLHADSAVAALDLAYARGENDEFVKPTVIGKHARIADGDAVVFMNFRADRAREISHAFVDASISGFPRSACRNSAFVSLTDYAESSRRCRSPSAAVDPQLRRFRRARITQLRIAETEKYAHVTFFFSGGREAPFVGEERILVPSPNVATYDLKPEMSGPKSPTGSSKRSLRRHSISSSATSPTRTWSATPASKRRSRDRGGRPLDRSRGRRATRTRRRGADHRRSRQCRADARRCERPAAYRAHVVVPCLFTSAVPRRRTHGALRDLAPTVLALMDLPQPAEMTGHALFDIGK